MPKKQKVITCKTGKTVTAELRYDRITISFLKKECQITEFFCGYNFNFLEQVLSTSPDTKLVDEQLYAVQTLKKDLLLCG